MDLQDKEVETKDTGNRKAADNGKLNFNSCIGCFGAADDICQGCRKMQIAKRVDKS